MNSRRRLKGLRFCKIMNTTGQKKIVAMRNKVLVTDAGLLGVAAIEKFLSAGWDVVGVSLRKPKLPSGRDIQFLSVDLRDEKAARAAFEPLTDITHIAYTAIHEKPELVAGWSSKEQIETNNAMLRNVVEPIVRTASNFQHISILQGTKSTACTCTRSPSRLANVMPVRTTRTFSSTTKNIWVRWAPGTASTTRHCVR